MRHVDSAGIRLATESFGSTGDPAVMLVMGATASMLTWPEGLCRSLADRGYFVIRYDNRDTGLSTTRAPGNAAYAVEDMADDLVGVMRAIRWTPRISSECRSADTSRRWSRFFGPSLFGR